MFWSESANNYKWKDMPRRTSDEAQPILDHHNENNDDGDDLELETSDMCCSPRKSYYRFIALIFMCLVGFGKLRCIRRIKIRKGNNFQGNNCDLPRRHFRNFN